MQKFEVQLGSADAVQFPREQSVTADAALVWIVLEEQAKVQFEPEGIEAGRSLHVPRVTPFPVTRRLLKRQFVLQRGTV